MDGRSRLLASSIALVEDVASAGSRRAPAGEDFSPDFQVAFPHHGLFIWHVCGDDVVGDTNQVLFVRGGEPFRISHPRPGGYAELIVTPSMPVLAELTEAAGFAPHQHPLFRARSRRATPAVQRLSAHLLHTAWRADDGGALAGEERVLTLLRAALAAEPVRVHPSARTRRLLRRAKEFLHEAFTTPLRLEDIARAAGASPAYLTDVFRRFEGISLQRYVTQLRLGRALIELPYRDDLTALALDLGFSSHSHFTLAFRRSFGCTPSWFRRSTRREGAALRPPKGSFFEPVPARELAPLA
jgi:AraC family transcriptional regulator